MNKTNRHGWTPLTLAANLGEVDDMIDCCFLFRKEEKDPILQLLLQESIDTNKMDTNGKLPSVLAEKNKLVFMPDDDYDYENVDAIEEEEEVTQVKLFVIQHMAVFILMAESRLLQCVSKKVILSEL